MYSYKIEYTTYNNSYLHDIYIYISTHITILINFRAYVTFSIFLNCERVCVVFLLNWGRKKVCAFWMVIVTHACLFLWDLFYFFNAFTINNSAVFFLMEVLILILFLFCLRMHSRNTHTESDHTLLF